MRIALALSLLCALAGCKKTLHWKLIEDELVSRAGAQAPGMRFAAVCPETPVEEGLIFRCRVTASDSTGEDIEVKLLDTAGSYAMRVAR